MLKEEVGDTDCVKSKKSAGIFFTPYEWGKLLYFYASIKTFLNLKRWQNKFLQ
jgi:hypothetical protein